MIVALMAIVILTAIGFFALTMISGDLMISSRLTGERKAMSAAESGVQAQIGNGVELSTVFLADGSCIQVDPTNDPSSCYIVVSKVNTKRQVSLGGMGTFAMSDVYNITITGKDTNYGSSMTIDIGMVPPGAPSDINIISGTQPGE